ncbi:MAG: alpha/beta hydrolase, partial [Pirellulaceae bacterium]|nr:alpha/beta hydrolase [Pirellulaceae bacterium]
CNQNFIYAQDSTLKKAESYFNLPTKTMGGKQVWTDFVHLRGYRIQQNVMTKHYRLLDPKDVRLAWGNMQGCTEELQKIAEKKELQPVSGRVLIVLHGLIRSRGGMQSIADYVAEETDITVINMSYASARTSIDRHAAALASVVSHLPEATEIDFLAHSMGNIVIRYYLGQLATKEDPRFRRMVMLAPPNKGSRLARLMQDNLLFKTFWGVSGQELSRHWEVLESKLCEPEFEFGIIAGMRPESSSLDNPLFGEKNDLVVSVEETRLPGAADFIQMDLLHSTMMNDDRVKQATTSFLENGFFRSAAEREPIPAKN